MKGIVNVPGAPVPKMATGSYTGTGGDQTLTFDFEPKLICIRSGILDVYSFTSYAEAQIIGRQTTIVGRLDDEEPELIMLSWPSDKSVTMYKGDNSEHLFSREGKTYSFFAIGE